MANRYFFVKITKRDFPAKSQRSKDAFIWGNEINRTTKIVAPVVL
jgi:hypothetical protein